MPVPSFPLIICLLSPLFSLLDFADEVGSGLPVNGYLKFSKRIGDLPKKFTIFLTVNKLQVFPFVVFAFYSI